MAGTSISGASGLTRKRVISAKGIISPRGDEGQGVARQRAALEAEGVEVTTLAGAGGEKVDIRQYGWFPEQVDL
jgi:methylated-DNA-protein-cysteine methyltransferase-like protein